MLDERTRPRLARTSDGLLLILRAASGGRDGAPGGPTSLRFWVSRREIVVLGDAPAPAVAEMAERLLAGSGPTDPGTALADLVERITDGLDPVVEAVTEEIDSLEVAVVDGREDEATRPRLAALPRRLVRLRRHGGPQRDAVAALARARTELLDDAARLDLAESAEHAQRQAEEADGARERAVILLDELAARADERVARQSFRLTVAATAFLPATLLTGLLGVDLAGVPGAETPGAFWWVAALCLVLMLVLARRWS